MSLAERRWLRLFTLCALYVAQGIPWGFTATTIPNFLKDRGLDDGLINATLAFTVLPYSFKWVWGPVIDSITIPRFGRRRPWILLAQSLMASTILAMVAIDVVDDIRLLAWMILIHTVFNSLQDVAVDALAIDLLDDSERGRANGLMYGSKYLGGFVGGAGMVTLIEYTSFNTALVVQTAILVAIMMVPFLVRETAGPPPPRPPFREVMADLSEAFSVRSALVTAFLLLAIHFTSGLMTATSRALYLGPLGWDYADYTRATGGLGLVVGGCGAALGGILVDRFGRRRLIACASCALALGWLVFALARPLWSEDWFTIALTLYEPLAQSILAVSLFSLCMELSWPRVAGSQFSTYMALLNFSQLMGYQTATYINDVWDFHGVYALAAGYQIVVTLLLVFIDPTETRRTLPRPAGTTTSMRGVAALVILLAALAVFTAYATYLRLR